jgi:hypothetical protein
VDAIVGALSRIVQLFKVAINAKGGDCWHVYRQSVLVIDGKNNNDDGRFTNRVYMARTSGSPIQNTRCPLDQSLDRRSA